MNKATYSMIWISYFEMIIVFGVLIYLLIVLYRSFFKGKNIAELNQTDPREREFAKKHSKHLNNILRIGCLILIFVNSLNIYDHIKDLPSVLNDNYKTAIFRTVSKDLHGNDVRRRHIMVKEINNSVETDFEIYSQPVYENVCLEIHYYPNIRIGEIIKQVDCNFQNLKG